MPAWLHGEWRLLRALISHAAGSRSEGHALPKQIDAEGQQLLPGNATAVVLLAERPLRCLPQPAWSGGEGRTDERQLAARQCLGTQVGQRPQGATVRHASEGRTGEH